METKKAIAIVGPTAAGKTNLSIKLAKKFSGEVVSADSRQVYRGMDISTGKITKKEMDNIPHYLLDVVSPKRIFTVAQYKKKALRAIENIHKKGKIPFLVGGTALYLYTVIDNISIPGVKPDWKLRKKLQKKTKEELYNQLKKLDPRRAQTIEKNNKRRLIRALEIILKTKKPVPPLKSQNSDFDFLILGIKKSKEKLEKLIKKRLEKRLNQGMIAEVKRLKNSGVSWKRLESFGLECKHIAKYLRNKITEEEMKEKLQKEEEHFAKRQMTWFKKDKRIHWIKNQKEAEKLIRDFLCR